LSTPSKRAFTRTAGLPFFRTVAPGAFFIPQTADALESYPQHQQISCVASRVFEILIQMLWAKPLTGKGPSEQYSTCALRGLPATFSETVARKSGSSGTLSPCIPAFQPDKNGSRRGLCCSGDRASRTRAETMISLLKSARSVEKCGCSKSSSRQGNKRPDIVGAGVEVPEVVGVITAGDLHPNAVPFGEDVGRRPPEVGTRGPCSARSRSASPM